MIMPPIVHIINPMIAAVVVGEILHVVEAHPRPILLPVGLVIIHFSEQTVHAHELGDKPIIPCAVDGIGDAIHVLEECFQKPQQLTLHILINQITRAPLGPILPLLNQRLPKHTKVMQVQDTGCNTKATVHIQDMDGIPFSIHCTRDDRFVTKLMSTHGLLTEVDDHKTYRQKDGGWVSFNYVEYLSHHNLSKHWVDDVNNRSHDHIGLEQVWHTKCWETQQFTFISFVAEANPVYLRARVRQGKTTPQLAFRRKLALKMLTNNIEDIEIIICSHISGRKRRKTEMNVGHELTVRPNFTKIWKTNDITWAK